ncbi:MAG: phosphate regulon sensor histidine kinase PhoR [Sedimenticola sp.]|nr:phosphate regulon sensor histidine kinase PhoR [Sedimenticola sp.]MCW8882780.1 phosphate regulon sensor histidine kinase PhoR [Sedimenticola sp.]MCW8947014.1 phosphate regulon sensor histidine kinase PhoR [Sedimenticola sp.]MCW8974863.1 phosphate regulon sensor histidine kinase PhoR [Sedimenticola sp.]MDF1527911.1 phosphate regulon sensor histidine kinase PhoR [Sedimenticola sp.]
MSLPEAWRGELVGFGFATVLLIALGLGTGFLIPFLWGGLTLYLGWHLYQLFRFTRWLNKPKSYPRPHAIGIWQPLMLRVDQLSGRGQKRKRKLSRMLSGFLESTGALPDATVVLNDEGRLDWWNSVASEFLGLDRKLHKGALIDELVTDPVFISYLHAGNYSRSLHMPAPVNDNISLEVRIVPYGKGKRLLQARDITRLHQLEIVRRDFVANVSHEIRTPLTVVHGYVETMQESGDAFPGPWKRIIDQMRIQTLRMQRIVDDLLLLSRLETRSSSEGQGVVGVFPILRGVLEGARQLSGEKQQVITLDADERLRLVGSSHELESAFTNLAYNAVRYTPAKGTIAIRWWLSGTGPCFSVTDSGIGISPEHIPRLTERFYRVDIGRSRESGGTGLGLAIVKHVLTRHDARLQVESEPGKGSVFTCRFPHSRVAS